jgi:hypothetical protein
MARPLTPSEILATFERWGVPHHQVDGWKTRSNKSGWSQSGVSGCMHHHTAGDGSDLSQLTDLVKGDARLRGPKANFGVRETGRIDIISAGAANHAGGGDPRVLRAVQLENYDAFPPKTHKHHKSPGAVGGNGKFYGWETYCGGPGRPRMNDKQYRVLVLSTAAIISALDDVDGPGTRWTGRSCIAHKEWSTHKPVDPRLDMSVDRADITWCLEHGPQAARQWFATGQRTTDPDHPLTPTSKEPIMHTLVQLKNTDPVWISDLITRRWVQTPTELSVVQRSLKKAGVAPAVTVVSTLAPYGVPVGPLPGQP